MRTLLSQFCLEFEQIVRPLLTPLHRAADALGKAPQDLPAREIRAELTDLRHQMEVLVDKVAEQQAFVLIFGPLKSGKSTLMNALCGTYVSEVSSLPAYPCMVFVSHSPAREFTVTDYKGDTEVFTDTAALHIHIDRAHVSLAEQIRRVEERGEQFDPAEHFPAAIRKIDVKLPAGDLAQSGAVLVDTPGLYSRMKFGYDRMTRDFRNAAACAIFVVKSDNLFLEQVFEEFSQLLELFSRIFLVVNLDTTKCDLSPDGRLVPSLEQQDPQRIIEAFENLAMSAPLKKAADQGRLRIYPVGLLQAASHRLQATRPGDRAAKVEVVGEANFAEFQRDLTDYLNSTDYLVAFLGDSLRRATALLGESKQLCEHQSVRRLESVVADLEQQRSEVERRRSALQQIGSRDWTIDLKALQRELGQEVQTRTDKLGSTAADAIDAAVDRWFHSDASLQDLLKEEVAPLLTSFQEQLSLAAADSLRRRISRGKAGLQIDGALSSATVAGGIDFSKIGREVFESLSREDLIVVPSTPLRSEHLPVRKRFVDWLLFRRGAAVRRRVFGPPDRPALRIPVDVKQTRLGAVGKRAIVDRLQRFRDQFCAEAAERARADFLGGYARGVHRALNEQLQQRKGEQEARLAEIDARVKDCRGVLGPVRDLRTASGSVVTAVEELSNRYGRTDPGELLKPVPAEYELPAPPRSGAPRMPQTEPQPDATPSEPT